MTGPAAWALPAELAAADAELLGAIDGELQAGERRAGKHLACRRGCTPCCVGPFDITVLDAARLARAMAALERTLPPAAEGIRRRAAAQWRAMAKSFPGDVASGLLGADEAAREEFFARFSDAPCPALEPGTGACLLYAARPVSCRTYGLPVRVGTVLLPACALNFADAAADEIEAATVAPDPEDREGALLRRAGALGLAGETVVAAALAAGTR